MTLTKIKPRRPSATHKLRSGRHHRQNHSYLKTYWPYLPILTVVVLAIFANNWLGHQHKNVLGYATDISIQSLLDDTNAQRAANGLPPLTINAELDLAAQTKANDMETQNYWSHDTPEGQTPWSFITAAGYDYQAAGENLAYGFDTASDTLTAWMNSPEHRANILNTTYHDVGFGVVNIANYVGTGPETLVDAMYGSLAGEAVVAATPQVSVPKSTVQAKAVTPSTTKSTTASSSPTVTSTTPVSQPISTPVATTEPSTKLTPEVTKAAVAAESQQQISRIQLVAAGSTTLAVLLVILFGCAAFAFLVIRHGMAWRKTFVRGERFILRHPSLDMTAAFVVAVSVILTRVTGIIK